MLKNLKSYAIIAAFALGITLAYNHGYDKANTKWEQEVHNEYVKKVEATADKQAALNEVSRQYQEDLVRWKAALIGSLMICVTMVSGCVSNYQPPHENSKLTVDASLMVEPNLTKSLVSVLSE